MTPQNFFYLIKLRTTPNTKDIGNRIIEPKEIRREIMKLLELLYFLDKNIIVCIIISKLNNIIKTYSKFSIIVTTMLSNLNNTKTLKNNITNDKI